MTVGRSDRRESHRGFEASLSLVSASRLEWSASCCPAGERRPSRLDVGLRRTITRLPLNAAFLPSEAELFVQLARGLAGQLELFDRQVDAEAVAGDLSPGCGDFSFLPPTLRGHLAPRRRFGVVQDQFLDHGVLFAGLELEPATEVDGALAGRRINRPPVTLKVSLAPLSFAGATPKNLDALFRQAFLEAFVEGDRGGAAGADRVGRGRREGSERQQREQRRRPRPRRVSIVPRAILGWVTSVIWFLRCCRPLLSL